MKTIIRLGMWAVGLAATAGIPFVFSAPLWGQETEPAPSAATGRVLVLDNDRTLEGEIERAGDQYRIKRAVGETWLPAKKVLCLCANVEEAYQFLRRRANLSDPDEHVRLARWCQSHGLRGLALEEVTAALELRPNHRDSQRLQRSLNQYATMAAALPSKATTETAPEPTPPPLPEFNPASLGLFVTRVQPILMNTCVSCHAGDRRGSFKLTRTYGDGRSNQRITQQNLAAVLSQVNRERLLSSPLLTRAVLAHGTADQPPIKNRQAPAYRTLEEWIKLATASPDGKEPSKILAEVAAQVTAISKTAPSSFADQPAPAKNSGEPADKNATPAPKSADPFDPAEFNKQMHPNK